jgi:hypothetical protein
MTTIDRDEAVKRLKAAMKQATGRNWRVYGDRGTAWGWLNVRSPKSRTVGDFDYMNEEDCCELGRIFHGGRRDCHQQGYSISPDSREWAVETAEAAARGGEMELQPTAASYECADFGNAEAYAAVETKPQKAALPASRVAEIYSRMDADELEASEECVLESLARTPKFDTDYRAYLTELLETVRRILAAKTAPEFDAETIGRLMFFRSIAGQLRQEEGL